MMRPSRGVRSYVSQEAEQASGAQGRGYPSKLWIDGYRLLFLKFDCR